MTLTKAEKPCCCASCLSLSKVPACGEVPFFPQGVEKHENNYGDISPPSSPPSTPSCRLLSCGLLSITLQDGCLESSRDTKQLTVPGLLLRKFASSLILIGVHGSALESCLTELQGREAATLCVCVHVCVRVCVSE